MATAISVESLKETSVSLRVSDEQTGEQQITRPARLYHYTATLDATPYLYRETSRRFLRTLRIPANESKTALS